MIIAKTLEGQDNKSFMHEKYPFCCKTCHHPIKQTVNENFQLKKRGFDVSYTQDGYLIVSERFKNFCENKGYKTLIFNALIHEPNFYFLEVSDLFLLDYDRRNVQFIDLCNDCNRYAEVIGASPSFIKEGFEFDKNVFYKSEFDFGSFYYKAYLIIIDTSVAVELSNAKFKGLYFSDVLK